MTAGKPSGIAATARRKEKMFMNLYLKKKN
jgi:hypothetical protein